MITQEDIKSRFSYSEGTGHFTSIKTGKRVGFSKPNQAGNNYTAIAIGVKHYFAHRLAWLYVYGAWPVNQIDHINGDSQDNRICNLRDVDATENMRNRKIHKNNTSGHMGVCWNKTNKTWMASIKVRGKLIYLGCFKHKKDAIKERREAEIENRFHKNHGRSRYKV